MTKIRMKDVKEFIKLIKMTYEKEYFLELNTVNALIDNGNYILKFKDIYYPVKAENVKYGFDMFYCHFRRLMNNFEDEDYIEFVIPEEDIHYDKYHNIKTGLLKAKDEWFIIELIEKPFKQEVKNE